MAPSRSWSQHSLLGGVELAAATQRAHHKRCTVYTLQLVAIAGSLLLLASCWRHHLTPTLVSQQRRELLGFSGREAPCVGVSAVPLDDRCEFVTTHCECDSLLNYLHVYYCHVQPAGWIACLSFQVACLLGMALLFRVLSTTAEDYFSPILTQMAKDFYLPPRLAGVTLMAWGNGAPDIFSSMAAVKSGEYQLALGGQLGAGMFIGTIVVGCVLRAGKGASMRGALIRDVSSYMLSVAVVAIVIGSGQVTMGKAAMLLGGYLVFVAVVCTADITHRLRRKPSAAEARAAVLIREANAKDLEEGLLTPPDSPGDSPRLRPASAPTSANASCTPTPGPVAPLPLQHTLSAAHSLDHSISDRSIELQTQAALDAIPRSSNAMSPACYREGDALQQAFPRRATSVGGDALPPAHIAARAARRHRHSHAGGGDLPALSPPLSYSDMVHMPGSKYREQAWAALSDSPSFRRLRVNQLQAEAHAGEYHSPSRASVDNCFLDSAPVANAVAAVAAEQAAAQPDAECPAGSSAARDGGFSGTQRIRWLQAAHYATLRGFVEQHLLQRLLAAVMVLEWPLTILRRATIPLLEQECYSRRWLVASMGLAPLAVSLYLHCGLLGIVLAVLMGFGAAAAAYASTQGPEFAETPPDWNLGTNVPIGAVLVALAGFAVACMWIDTVASELVGLLRFFGVLAHISSLVLGLTLLAWGNSIPDLITDVAMARTGYCNMAMTACFAGPLCNILCGLGLGFLLLTSRSGGAVEVALSLPVLTDAVIVVVNCGLVLALGLANRGHLPQRAALYLTCLYGFYMLINLGVHYV